ncbi:MAG: AMP-binding protein [Chloroflexi bacterium]|nr:AMP-binding protein [Chloroflexota bacterium]
MVCSGPALDGVVPFPPEYMARYRQRGYWEDRPLISHFRERFARFHDRVAVIDGERRITYAELGEQSRRVALNLLDLGLQPLDRVVVQLPNSLEFVLLYFAMQQIGAIPIMALPSHRFREVSQFVRLSGAVGTATPESARDVSFIDLVQRIRQQTDTLRLGLVLADAAPAGFVAIHELLTRVPGHTPADLERVQAGLNPCDPAVFQLSGGTTGVPKLIPRTHNDYAFNSKLAVGVCDVRDGDVLLDVLPISHNLPLACPGLQGFLLRGATIVMGRSVRPRDVFEDIRQHQVTHIHLVPALLIRWINDPDIGAYAPDELASVRIIQSGGQRLQPDTRLRTERVFPNCTVQENFGMSEGLLMFVRLDDPPDVRLETVGRPICPDDEVRIVDEEDRDVPDGEVGEMLARGPYTLRGYFRSPEHNTQAFTRDGFYRSGDLMRRHPSGNYMVEGRKKDLINRGGEKISAEEIENLILGHPAVQNVACVALPDPLLGERMCACVLLRPGARLSLLELVEFLTAEEIARHKLPERLEIMDQFPLSPIGKVSKKDLVTLVSNRAQTPTKDPVKEGSTADDHR